MSTIPPSVKSQDYTYSQKETLDKCEKTLKELLSKCSKQYESYKQEGHQQQLRFAIKKSELGNHEKRFG